MQKGFIFLLIIWNSSLLAAGNSSTKQLQFLLGCQAVIPCQDCRSGSDSFKWLYKKDEQSDKILIIFQDKTGLQLHGKYYHPKMKINHKCSLVINNISENNQGLYWCESCSQDKCFNKQATVTSVKTEIQEQVKHTVFITAGDNFNYSCLGELNDIKWTYEVFIKTAFRGSIKRRGSHFVTSNKSVKILNVQREEAGKYTCWKTGCDRDKQLLTLNLCVITEQDNEDSSVSCAVTCDSEFSNIEPNHISNAAKVTMNVDQYGLLNCSTKHMLDEYSAANTTYRPSNGSSKTPSVSTQPEHWFLIYGTSAAATCLILIAFFIYCLRSRLQTAFPIHLCCCGSNGRGEEETSVVYSSIAIRRPTDITNNNTTNSVCVYSEINV